MKRIVLLFLTLILLTGCNTSDREMDCAMELRSRCLAAEMVSFQAEITVDYIDTMEEFTLKCETDAQGIVSFCVAEPEAIADITGKVSGEEGALTFDDQMIVFPLMADEQISPISGPWVVMEALRSGVITACAQEGELLHLTINDDYSDDPLTVEVWVENMEPCAAEISWRGRRFLSMQINDFGIV